MIKKSVRSIVDGKIDALLDEIEKRNDNLDNEENYIKDSNFVNVLDAYYSSYLKDKVTNTCLSYFNDVYDFLFYMLMKKCVVSSINSDDIKKYMAYLTKKNISPRTRSRKLSAIKSFFAFLYENEYVSEPVGKELKAPKLTKNKMPSVLSVEEVRKILSYVNDMPHLNKRNIALFELLCYSGLRVSELVGITIDNIHTNEKTIYINGKGGKIRKVLLNDYQAKAIELYRNTERKELLEVSHTNYNHLFLNKNGTPLTRTGVNFLLKEIVKATGITTNCHPHTLRHSYATHLVEYGVELPIIKKILGHSSISTTEIYIHLSTYKTHEEYLKTHPRVK